MKTILITGGAGFVGSNLAILTKEKYPGYQVVCLDNLKRRGSELNLLRLRTAGIEFVHGDIRNKADFEQVKGNVDVLVDAAAEPSVLAGLDGQTDYLVDTNLNGTIHALNYAAKKKSKFIFLSTSRVYPIQPIEQIAFIEQDTRFMIADEQTMAGVSRAGISEAFPLRGSRSLYGATKLASELIVEEYHEMFGLETIVNRCGVITGPYQMGKVDQGVVVLWMARHFWKKNLSYVGYGGEGKQLRDLLHIRDLFTLVDRQIQDFGMFNGQTLNVGGGNKVSASLLELTGLCEEITGNKIVIDSVAETRKADIRLYVTDYTRVNQLCGWEPQISLKETLVEIHEWISSNESALKDILS